ncbi:hypothetical protein DEO72_LG7g560 [Vigna unguiculata]|uniref:Uncharacterized protein n=1 Tax=Vigna unguiculata TaxID=3917 RepID=A0A4D6MD10_VIGUN|nr:hypothetical protein DEO72_LG7g560 [Vigna unguiculata]
MDAYNLHHSKTSLSIIHFLPYITTLLIPYSTPHIKQTPNNNFSANLMGRLAAASAPPGGA